MMMYDVPRLITRAAELGLQKLDIAKKVSRLPKDERVSITTVYRVFELQRGRPASLRAIAKVLGVKFEDLVKYDAT
jgi:hypothetical protein